MCVQCSIEVHLLGKGHRRISFTSEREGGEGFSVLFKKHNTILRMKYLQIRHG